MSGSLVAPRIFSFSALAAGLLSSVFELLHRFPAIAIVALVAGELFVSSAGGAEATIYNLGTLGGSYSYGYAMNDAGQAAGFSSTAGSTGHRAFRYTGTPGSGGMMADLGTLGGTSSAGFAINAAGQVAGESLTPSDAAQHAFRYTGTPGSAGAMADLGTLGGDNSFGTSINGSGQVAGYSDTVSGSADRHAFRYTGTPGSGGAMADLGTLGGIYSQGNAINDSGQVAGTSRTTRAGQAPQHAFRYTSTPGSGGMMVDLGTFGGLYSTYSAGLGINNSGQVVGTSATADGDDHAFRYTGTPGSGGKMADLGTLGGANSQGFAINVAGQVAGSSYTAGDTAEHAFLYTGTPGVDGQMIDLDVWLHANNPIGGAQWTLNYAYGLTDTGLITGYGAFYDGGVYSDRAFVLDASALVPEPGGLSVLGAGGLAVLLRRRRDRAVSCAGNGGVGGK